MRNHALLRQQGHFYLPSGFGQSGALQSALHSAGNRFRRRFTPSASPFLRTGRHSVFYGGGRHFDFSGGCPLFTAHGTGIEGEVKTHRAFPTPCMQGQSRSSLHQLCRSVSRPAYFGGCKNAVFYSPVFFPDRKGGPSTPKRISSKKEIKFFVKFGKCTLFY